MRLVLSAVRGAGLLVFALYWLGVMVTMPYYNWQYARDNGFVSWLFLGQTVPTFKAMGWPYFVTRSMPAAAQAVDPGGKILEYIDNEHSFAFQFPSNWKLTKTPMANEVGEVRATAQGPRGRVVMATVGRLEKSISRGRFETSPIRDDAVNAIIDHTIEQVYKRMSAEIKASRMVVGDRERRPSDVGIRFYISTAQFMPSGVTMVVAGQHIIPFDTAQIISFIMVSPLDKNATADNQEITNVFNSFHLLSQRPLR